MSQPNRRTSAYMWYIQTKTYWKDDELLADQNHTTNMQELGTMQFSSVLNSWS